MAGYPLLAELENVEGITVAFMVCSPSRRTARRPEEGEVLVRTAEAVDHVVSLLPTTSSQTTAHF